MEAFLAIEKILHFHHTTSRQPLRVSQVRLRAFKLGTPVSLKDIETIQLIYPLAYHVYRLNGNLVMDAPDLPHNLEVRRETFYMKWQDKENIIAAKPSTPLSTSVNTLKPIDDNDGHKPKILMGRVSPQPKNTKLSLLERIRAKENSRACADQQTITTCRDKFLKSQIPKLRRVLSDIANLRNGASFEMSQIMELLRTNLFRLGDSEISRVLHLLTLSDPNFCSIVTVGDVTHVKLRPLTV